MGFARDQIVSFVKEYLDSSVDSLKYDKTLTGKILSINNASATVLINGESTTCRIKDGILIAVNDIVLVKVPNNNKNLKYIDGKLKK